MKNELKQYLFAHNYLIGEPNQDSLYATYALAKKLGIVVTSGEYLASLNTLNDASCFLGEKIPLPFYKGFPETVKQLSGLEVFIDQILSYFETYGLGMWDEQQHSKFEEEIERAAFRENTTPKKFQVVTEEDAVKLLEGYFNDALASSRPLNNDMMNFVCNCIDEYHFKPETIASKDTVIALLLKYKDDKYARFLHLNDVLKVIEKMHAGEYTKFQWNQLNMPNQERKFVTKLIHKAFKPSMENFERAKIWKGLLHHIHFKPITKEEEKFVKQIRDGSGESAYSFFEQNVDTDPVAAAKWLAKKKGGATVLRKLDFILSRCKKFDQVRKVLDSIETDNTIVLLQLLIKYNNYSDTKSNRTFIFHNQNLVKTHTETNDEVLRRKSIVPAAVTDLVKAAIMDKLASLYKNKLGKVYIEESFRQMSLPIFQSTGSYDFGTLPTGTTVQLPSDKKLRLFTYWERVNDIDMSIMGLDKSGKTINEFSFRTLGRYHTEQREQKQFGIVFSGDQTSGYHGGSEYYDIDIDVFKKTYPNIKYLIVDNNVYSGCYFSNVFCKAGYMLRDKLDSGEVYEPKTVQTGFKIDCNSTYAHLFGIDLEHMQLIWLNIAKESNSRIAAGENNEYLTKYFGLTDIINVAKLFELAATEVVDKIEDADIVVSDDAVVLGENQIQITSRDQEKIMQIMENK